MTCEQHDPKIHPSRFRQLCQLEDILVQVERDLDHGPPQTTSHDFHMQVEP